MLKSYDQLGMEWDAPGLVDDDLGHVEGVRLFELENRLEHYLSDRIGADLWCDFSEVASGGEFNSRGATVTVRLDELIILGRQAGRL